MIAGSGRVRELITYFVPRKEEGTLEINPGAMWDILASAGRFCSWLCWQVPRAQHPALNQHN